MPKFLIVWMFIACVAIKGSLGLHCVQCSSLENPLCTVGLVMPAKCKQTSGACLTYIGKMPIPGMDVVIRDCAQVDMGTFCQNVPAGPDTFEHEFCVKTCYRSSCNNVNMLTSSAITDSRDKFPGYSTNKGENDV